MWKHDTYKLYFQREHIFQIKEYYNLGLKYCLRHWHQIKSGYNKKYLKSTLTINNYVSLK